MMVKMSQRATMLVVCVCVALLPKVRSRQVASILGRLSPRHRRADHQRIRIALRSILDNRIDTIPPEPNFTPHDPYLHHRYPPALHHPQYHKAPSPLEYHERHHHPHSLHQHAPPQPHGLPKHTPPQHHGPVQHHKLHEQHNPKFGLDIGLDLPEGFLKSLPSLNHHEEKSATSLDLDTTNHKQESMYDPGFSQPSGIKPKSSPSDSKAPLPSLALVRPLHLGLKGSPSERKFTDGKDDFPDLGSLDLDDLFGASKDGGNTDGLGAFPALEDLPQDGLFGGSSGTGLGGGSSDDSEALDPFFLSGIDFDNIPEEEASLGDEAVKGFLGSSFGDVGIDHGKAQLDQPGLDVWMDDFLDEFLTFLELKNSGALEKCLQKDKKTD